MKKFAIIACIVAGASGEACAQSSVTLYGLVSTGIVYANNQGGHSSYSMQNGGIQNNRWGLKGTEDLGSGLKAIFTLENGFSSTSGTLSNGGREFGRQAFVGLSSDTFGTVTLGRQYDEMVQTLCFFSLECQFGVPAAHIGDSDNVFDTFRINNAFQYQSPQYKGLQFTGLYGFSDATNGFSNNNAYSAALTYQTGPFSAGASFLLLNKPNGTNTSGAVSGDYGFTSPFITNPATKSGVSQQRAYGVGGTYAFGVAHVALLYTNVLFQYLDTSRLSLQNFEASGTVNVRPNIILGLSYVFTTGQYHPQDSSPKWHQVTAGADYLLTKRTDLFAEAAYQRAAGSAQFAEIYSLSPSSGKSQIYATVGIRHKF